MKNKKGALLPMCLLLWALLMPGFAEQSGDWQSAYYDFIFGKGYLTSGQAYARPGEDAYEEVRFSLYDMDRDGVPELLASNGDYTHASASSYVYTFRNSAVKYLGGMGCIDDIWYYPQNAEFPGLFSEYGQMGYGIVGYDALEQGALKSETIVETDYNIEPVKYKQITHDDALYRFYMDQNKLSRPDNGRGLTLVGEAEAQNMGWEAFLALFQLEAVQGYMEQPMGNPLISPADGAIISLWEQKGVTVRWRSVEGAKRYDIEIKCAWPGTNGQSIERTVYSQSFPADSLPDQGELSLEIPLDQMNLSAVPAYADLAAAVILRIEQ